MKAATISHSHGNSRVSMNGKLPSITTPIPGPRSREIFADEQRYVAPGRQRISLLAGVAFDHGEGATLTDADENVYLDFYAGVAVASLGHGHPALSRALARQASRLIVGTFATRERAEAFELLADAAPGISSARIFIAAAPKQSRPRCVWPAPRRRSTKSWAFGVAFTARPAA